MQLHPYQSKFAVRVEEVNQDNYHNKLIDERAMYEVYPNMVDYEMLEPTRRQVLTSSKGNIIDRRGTLMDVFRGSARMVDTTENIIRYKLYLNEGDVRGSFVRVVNPGNNQYLGLNNTRFIWELDVPWFGPNDIVILDGLREMPLLFRSQPEVAGSAYAYEVELLTDRLDAYFPADYVTSGTRLHQIGSLIGESTVERGNVHFGDGEAFIEFAVPQTRMGWEMKVTDNAWRKSRNFRLTPNEDLASKVGPQDILMNSLEMKFEEATNHQMDLYLVHGRSSAKYAGRFLDGITENPMMTGPGLYEYFDTSNVVDYNVDGGDLEQFLEPFPTMWNDRVPIEMRAIDLYTGTPGLKLWQKWAKAADQAGILQTPELNYANEKALYPGRNGVTLNAKQYRAVFIEPFGIVRVHHLPFLDSERIETRKYKGFPISGYEFFAFNTGLGDIRDENIYISQNKTIEQFGYSVGTWGPLGPMLGKANLNARFHTGNGRENAYYLIREAQIGLVIKDPGAMMLFRPSFF